MRCLPPVTLRAMSALTFLPSVFRILMLGLLMAGVLVKPVIAFAGELHEAGHAESTDQDGHDQDKASEPVAPSDASATAVVRSRRCCR